MLGLGIVLVPLVAGTHFEYLDVGLLVRLSMFVTIVGSAFIMDDATLAWSRVTPLGSVSIAGLRLATAFALVAPSVALQLALAPRLVKASAPYEPWGLAIEALTFLVLTVSGALWWAWNYGAGFGGVAAAPLLLIATLVVGFLPDSWALYVSPAAPDYMGSRQRWCVLLVASVLILAVQMLRASRVSQALSSSLRTRPRRR